MGKRMIIGLLCALMLGCALPGTGFAQAFPSGESSETIGPKIEAFFADREDKAVGMATSVFGPEGSYYRGFHGFADKENELAVSEETVFEWGSISKLLVWVSLMQLEERGLLDLKDDIRTYLPEGFFPALAYDTPITSLDLMHHTAGFEETIFGLQAKTVPEDFSLEAVLKESMPRQIYEPGTVIAYSNWGTCLGALMVEEITGLDFVDYVHQYIFAPLGMGQTALFADLSDNPWVQARHLETKAYNGKGELMEIEKPYILIYPAGMASGTLADLERFGQALLPIEGVPSPLFQEPDTLARFHEASYFYPDTDLGVNYHGMWHEEFAVSVKGHAGNTQGQSAQLLLDVDRGLGMAVLTNQAQEMAFNYQMPELVFGSMEDSDKLALQEGRAPGLYAMSRVAKEGPLKFLSLQIMPSFYEIPGFFMVPGHENGQDKIVMAVFEWHKLAPVQTLIAAGVYLFLLIAPLYGLLALLAKLIRGVRGKLPMKGGGWHGLSLVLVMAFIGCIAFYIRQVMTFGDPLVMVATSLSMAAVILVALVAYLFFIRSLWQPGAGRRAWGHVLMTGLLVLGAGALYVYLDLYHIWAF